MEWRKQYLQKLTSRFYATVDKCELRELLFELMGKDFMQAKLKLGRRYVCQLVQLN